MGREGKGEGGLIPEGNKKVRGGRGGGSEGCKGSCYPSPLPASPALACMLVAFSSTLISMPTHLPATPAGARIIFRRSQRQYAAGQSGAVRMR